MSAPTSDFQLTLFSDSSYFPSNKPAQFRVRLPTPIKFREFGPWKVGLVEIEVPHTWMNFGREVPIRVAAKFVGGAEAPKTVKTWRESFDALEMDLTLEAAKKPVWPNHVDTDPRGARETNLGPAHFEHPRELGEHLVSLFRALFREHRDYALEYSFNELTGKGRFLSFGVEITCVSDAYLFDALGMRSDNYFPVKLSTPPARRARFEDDVDGVYLYSDICSLTNVGGVDVPLLATRPVSRKKFGAVTQWTASPVYYMPVSVEELDTLSIELRDVQGKFVRFNGGTVICRLHFTNKD